MDKITIREVLVKSRHPMFNGRSSIDHPICERVREIDLTCAVMFSLLSGIIDIDGMTYANIYPNEKKGIVVLAGFIDSVSKKKLRSLEKDGWSICHEDSGVTTT